MARLTPAITAPTVDTRAAFQGILQANRDLTTPLGTYQKQLLDEIDRENKLKQQQFANNLAMDQFGLQQQNALLNKDKFAYSKTQDEITNQRQADLLKLQQENAQFARDKYNTEQEQLQQAKDTQKQLLSQMTRLLTPKEEQVTNPDLATAQTNVDLLGTDLAKVQDAIKTEGIKYEQAVAQKEAARNATIDSYKNILSNPNVPEATKVTVQSNIDKLLSTPVVVDDTKLRSLFDLQATTEEKLLDSEISLDNTAPTVTKSTPVNKRDFSKGLLGTIATMAQSSNADADTLLSNLNNTSAVADTIFGPDAKPSDVQKLVDRQNEQIKEQQTLADYKTAYSFITGMDKVKTLKGAESLIDTYEKGKKTGTSGYKKGNEGAYLVKSMADTLTKEGKDTGDIEAITKFSTTFKEPLSKLSKTELDALGKTLVNFYSNESANIDISDWFGGSAMGDAITNFLEMDKQLKMLNK